MLLLCFFLFFHCFSFSEQMAGSEKGSSSNAPLLGSWTSLCTSNQAVTDTPAAPHPMLQQCVLCLCLLGYRRKALHCAACNVSVCPYCAAESPTGALWCGVCDLPKSVSLAQTSSLFPSKALSSVQAKRASSEGSVRASGDKCCTLCGAEFGFFSARRKSLCVFCRQIVCNGCSTRVVNRDRAARSSSGPLDNIISSLQEASDARVCCHCARRK